MTLSDKYEIIRKLGHGASGDVYLVEHRTLKLFRAVKVISKHSGNAGHILREALIIRNLKYQGIPIIYDIDETPDEYYIYEEYVEGQTLTDYVQSSFLSLKDILDKAICLCSILDYLHHYGKGILHLDLKPDNIMIDSQNRLWLLDYGNSAMNGDTLTLCRGSEGFSPPQQYFGVNPDKSWDIYSLGMVLMYMSCGTVHSNICDLCHQQLTPIIRKCVHHNRFLRYRSAAALKKDLENILNKKSDTLEDFNSLYLNVIGTDQGVGVTHFCLCLCSFFNRNGLPALVVNKNRIDSYSQICAHAAQSANVRDGVFNSGNLNIIPADFMLPDDTLSKYKIIIQDCDNFPNADGINICLCSRLKPFNEKNTRFHISGIKQLFVIWNLCSTKFFYDSVKHCHIFTNNYRMPCVYDFNEGLDLCDNMLRELCADIGIHLPVGKRPGFFKERWDKSDEL